MRSAIATQSLQVHRVRYAPDFVILDGVAGLVGRFVDPKSLAAVLKNFGHEREKTSTQSPAR
jgi:hypothetical protein